MSAPEMTRSDVKILTEKVAYEGFGRVICYEVQYRLFAGTLSGIAKRELIDRHRVVAALPYDPERDQVVLVEQFRIGALHDARSPWLLELVAGIIDKPEEVESVLRREMQEETGLAVHTWEVIADYWVSPGASNEKVALFCARVDASLAQGLHGLAEETEDIRLHVLTAEETFAAVANGVINNAASIIAIQWLQLNRERLRKKWR